MAKIQLTQNKVALVDDEDYDELSSRKWYAQRIGKHWYAKRRNGYAHILMHEYLMGVSGVDHVNGDGLDNRRCNLRVATSSENSRNRRPSGKGTSKYKGVWRHFYHRNKWEAAIVVEGKQHRLGIFDTEEEAAKVYDQAAIFYYGEFALLNASNVTNGKV